MYLHRTRFRWLAAISGVCAVLGLAEVANGAQAKGQESSPEGSKAPSEKSVREIAEHLDQAEREIESWGQGAVSDFVLIDDRDLPAGHGRFEIDYTQPTSFYAGRVRETFQGMAAATDERTFDTSLRAKMSSDALVEANRGIALQDAALRSEWMKRLLANLQAGTNYSVDDLARFKTLVGSNDLNHPLPSLSNPPPSPLETSNAFAPAQALIAERGQARISEDHVTKIAASHKMTELVLNYMSHPIDLPGNKRAFFALTQVSLSPGWRTKRGYSAEIQVKLNYAASKSHMLRRQPKLPEMLDNDIKESFTKASPSTVYSSGENIGYTYGGGRVSPSVFSAFPLAEAQVFDLKSSYRSQTTFLLQLAGVLQQTGYKVDGELLLRYARRFQKDLNTASVLPVVVPTAGPNGLAYRFDPEVMALAEPSKRDSKSAELLLPTSFPALIVVVADRSELEDWSHLEMVVETRWIPTQKRHWFKQGAVDWWLYSHMPSLPRSNVERGLLSLHLDNVLARLGAVRKESPGCTLSDTYQELKRRYESLRVAGLGRTYQSELPVPAPQILRWGPSTLKADSEPTFEIFGDRLTDTDSTLRLALGGVPLEVKSATANAIQAKFATADNKLPAALKPGEYDLELEHGKGRARVAKAVVVREADASDPCKGINGAEMKITSVEPRHGYANAVTWLTMRGSGFRPNGKDPIRNVVVGGVVCTNVAVLSDQSLVVEVPPRFGKKPGVYPADISTPSIIAISQCRVADAPTDQRVIFDLEADRSPNDGRVALDPSLLEKARLLQDASTQLASPPRLQGDLSLSVRPAATSDAKQEPASGTSAIIQIGTSQTAPASGPAPKSN